MRRLHANLILLLVALIWGVTFSFQQMAMDHVGPLFFTGIRFLLGALAVLPVALWQVQRLRRTQNWTLDRAGAGGIVVVGCALFLGAWTQQVGIKGTTIANAGFLTALYVPLTPILVLLIMRRRPHLTVWPAAAACLAGAYFMAGGTLDTMREGDAWVIAGSFFWAIHIMTIGWVSKRTGAPFLVAVGQFVICGILGIGWGALSAEPVSAQGLWDALPMIAFAGLLSTAIAFTLQVVGQSHTPPADAAVILSAETVFAAVAGAVILGERLGTMEVLGGSLILAGVLAVELLPLWSKRRRVVPLGEA